MMHITRIHSTLMWATRSQIQCQKNILQPSRYFARNHVESHLIKSKVSPINNLFKSLLIASISFVSYCIFSKEAECKAEEKKQSGFSFNDTVKMAWINQITSRNYNHDGKWILTKGGTISCDTFSGEGLIRGPQISIKTNNFDYTGEIDCSGKCTIIASQPFDEKMFKRSGKGEFIIIIE